MNKDMIKQEIKNLMEVIHEQQGLLLSNHGKIPQIEMDIMLGNIRKAYELLTELNKIEQSAQPVTPVNKYPGESLQPEEMIAKAEPSSTTAKIIIPEIINEIIPVVNIMEETPASPANAPAHVQPELITANVDSPVEITSSEKISEAAIPQAAITKERTREYNRTTVKSSATASLFDDAPTIAEQFQGTPTILEKIAGSKEDKSIAEKLKKHPVTDLKKSIGINEKFAFINELFDGDLEGYNGAIDQLNSCTNYDDAVDILSNQLAAKYNWSDDGESYLQLKNLLERRFSS